MMMVYNVKVTPERNKDEFVVPRRFVSDKTPTPHGTVPLLPRGSIVDRDGTS